MDRYLCLLLEQTPGFQYYQANYDPLQFPNHFYLAADSVQQLHMKEDFSKSFSTPLMLSHINLSWPFIQPPK